MSGIIWAGAHLCQGVGPLSRVRVLNQQGPPADLPARVRDTPATASAARPSAACAVQYPGHRRRWRPAWSPWRGVVCQAIRQLMGHESCGPSFTGRWPITPLVIEDPPRSLSETVAHVPSAFPKTMKRAGVGRFIARLFRRIYAIRRSMNRATTSQPDRLFSEQGLCSQAERDGGSPPRRVRDAVNTVRPAVCCGQAIPIAALLPYRGWLSVVGSRCSHADGAAETSIENRTPTTENQLQCPAALGEPWPPHTADGVPNTIETPPHHASRPDRRFPHRHYPFSHRSRTRA